MIEHILEDIKLAKNNHAYISSLALALTLPNILSNIEHGRETHKNEYVQWFDKWVYKYYEQPESDNLIINKGIEATKFDGQNCYLLRCALLHSGNTDLKDSHGNRKIDVFELCVSEESAHCGDACVCDVSNTSVHNIWVSINVVGLIDSLIAGAKEFITVNKSKMENKSHQVYLRSVGSIRIEDHDRIIS